MADPMILTVDDEPKVWERGTRIAYSTVPRRPLRTCYRQRCVGASQEHFRKFLVRAAHWQKLGQGRQLVTHDNP